MKREEQPRNPKLASLAEHTPPDSVPVLIHNCFGCSQTNRRGLRLRFHENTKGGSVMCEFSLSRSFEGPPGHVHGGIIATLLDEAMGKVNRQKGIVALTRYMSVDYLQPVPLGVRLCVVGWPVRVEGRKHFHAGEIRTLDGKVLARSEGLFLAIDPLATFRKYSERVAPAAKTRRARTAKLKG